MRLDAKSVAALTLERKSDVIHFDEALSGFGFRLRRGAGGKLLRSWVVQYRRAGASRRMLLGSAEVLNAEQARRMAKTALARVAMGENPQAERVDRRGKDKLSFRSVVEEYLPLKQDQVRPKTFHELERYLTGAYFKPLHSMPVDTITRKDVAAQLVAISRQRGKVTAMLARTTLGAFFSWCLQMGIIDSNPVIGTPQPAQTRPRERVLSDAEMVAVWRVCKDDDFGRVVRLLMLLGARRSEVGGMGWGEFDLERATWTIPATRTKNGRQHTLPLMPTALEMIRQVPQRVSRDLLFGTRGNAGFNGWQKCKRALDQRAGIAPWTLHDIRRTVATRMADIGVQPHVIEQILNHQSGHRAGIAGIYNRSPYEREVRAALALWQDHVRTLVEGGERKVVPYAPPAAS